MISFRKSTFPRGQLFFPHPLYMKIILYILAAYLHLIPLVMIRNLILTWSLILGLFTTHMTSAQQMEMHSNSPEAIDLINEAMDNLGHDMDLFAQNIDLALEADPDMLVANFLNGMNPDASMDEIRPFLEKVQSYEGDMSAGEEIMKELSQHFEEEDYAFRESFEQIAVAYPGDARMQLFAGLVWMYGENPDISQAMPYLETAANTGEVPGAYNLLGYAYLQSGDMDRAKDMFDAYMTAAPDHSNPYDSMGDYYMAVEDYESAVSHFERAAEIAPENPYHAEKADKARGMMEK